MQTVEEELLKNSIEQMKTRIEKNPTITIYSLKQEAIQKSNEENYSTFLEIEFSVKDFESLVKFVYFYGPSSIEILKPEKVEIENNDLQDALMFMADINYKYADLVTKNMNKRQLEEFYQSVFK
ncbi:MAG: hypothetical protein Q7S92_03505 [Candidatus Diapherotrites archaeon]|nr:hypothetical protein [Candidatus Diapherotrites archaeon]